MKRKLAMIMVTSLLALSLSACGSSSEEESIIDSEDAAEAESEAAASGDETQAADETENVESEAVPAEETEAAPAEGTEAAAEETEAAEAGGPVELEGGSNQADAVPIALEQQVLGTNEDNSWFSFTTGSTPDVDYQITLINRTSSSGTVEANLLDLYGNNLGYVRGFEDGTAGTLTPEDKLDANTTYYIHISNFNAGTHDFSLIVHESTEEE